MLTIAECRMRAREHKALAERESRHRTHHLNAAEAWLLLATRMDQERWRSGAFQRIKHATLHSDSRQMRSDEAADRSSACEASDTLRAAVQVARVVARLPVA
jgi:hypothetical protein